MKLKRKKIKFIYHLLYDFSMRLIGIGNTCKLTLHPIASWGCFSIIVKFKLQCRYSCNIQLSISINRHDWHHSAFTLICIPRFKCYGHNLHNTFSDAIFNTRIDLKPSQMFTNTLSCISSISTLRSCTFSVIKTLYYICNMWLYMPSVTRRH